MDVKQHAGSSFEQKLRLQLSQISHIGFNDKIQVKIIINNNFLNFHRNLKKLRVYSQKGRF